MSTGYTNQNDTAGENLDTNTPTHVSLMNKDTTLTSGELSSQPAFTTRPRGPGSPPVVQVQEDRKRKEEDARKKREKEEKERKKKEQHGHSKATSK